MRYTCRQHNWAIKRVQCHTLAANPRREGNGSRQGVDSKHHCELPAGTVGSRHKDFLNKTVLSVAAGDYLCINVATSCICEIGGVLLQVLSFHWPKGCVLLLLKMHESTVLVDRGKHHPCYVTLNLLCSHLGSVVMAVHANCATTFNGPLMRNEVAWHLSSLPCTWWLPLGCIFQTHKAAF